MTTHNSTILLETIQEYLNKRDLEENSRSKRTVKSSAVGFPVKEPYNVNNESIYFHSRVEKIHPEDSRFNEMKMSIASIQRQTLFKINPDLERLLLGETLGIL